MMENSIEAEMKQICDLLRNALSTAFYMDMRHRFASEHQWDIEGPAMKKAAYMAWYAAKLSIGDRREELEKYLLNNKSDLPKKDVENFMAAIQVIDKEVDSLFEEELLEEPETDLDEDEEYVRQTSNDDGPSDDENIWDGDEYIGDLDDEDDLGCEEI